MRYIYVSKDGVLGDYVSTVRTQSTTGFKKVHVLQAAFNAIVRQYQSLDANADNCRAMWESLEAAGLRIVKELSEREKECDKFKELEMWLGGVGYELAFGARRKGVSKSSAQIYRTRFLSCEVGSPEFLDYFLKMEVCMTSNDFRKPRNAEQLWADYDEMSDDELMAEAVECRDKLLMTGLSERERKLVLRA